MWLGGALWISILIVGYGLWRRRCLNGDLVVLIAVFVSNLFLVISASPVTIYDVFVLILAWWQNLCNSELVLCPWHSLHGQSLLPIAE